MNYAVTFLFFASVFLPTFLLQIYEDDKYDFSFSVCSLVNMAAITLLASLLHHYVMRLMVAKLKAMELMKNVSCVLSGYVVSTDAIAYAYMI